MLAIQFWSGLNRTRHFSHLGCELRNFCAKQNRLCFLQNRRLALLLNDAWEDVAARLSFIVVFVIEVNILRRHDNKNDGQHVSTFCLRSPLKAKFVPFSAPEKSRKFFSGETFETETSHPKICGVIECCTLSMIIILLRGGHLKNHPVLDVFPQYLKQIMQWLKYVEPFC